MHTILGQPIPQRDSLAQITGTAHYLDDLPRDGVWVGGTVRTGSPHGRLIRIAYAAILILEINRYRSAIPA